MVVLVYLDATSLFRLCPHLLDKVYYTSAIAVFERHNFALRHRTNAILTFALTHYSLLVSAFL